MKSQLVKKKKSILFVNYIAYPCKIGGAEIFNYYLINELGKYYKVHVITYCDDCKYDKNIIVHKIIKAKFFKRIISPLQTFLFLLKEKNVKLIHVSFSSASWVHWFTFYLINKLLKVKYMVTIHGGQLAQWNPKRIFAYKQFFKNAFKITGVSQRIIDEYTIRTNRDDIVFTPPLIPFNIITPKNRFRDKWHINSDDVVLIYVGSLKPLKSVDTLIEALGIISLKKLEQYKLKLLIAGDGVSRKELENRMKELNLQTIVRFLGTIDTKKINQIYNLADIYTICSEYEGLPISTLEAFANKLPCVTSDAPGLHNLSMNNKNTLLFKTKDKYDYAKKIEILLNNKEMQNQLKKK